MADGTVVTKGTMSTDVLDMFPGIEADQVITKPANILSNDNSLSFLDNPGAAKVDPPQGGDGGAAAGQGQQGQQPPAGGAAPAAGQQGGQAAPAAAAAPAGDGKTADQILNLNPGADDDDDDDDEGAQAGAAGDGKKTGRDGITSYLKAKIEGGEFQAFEDWDEKKETLDAYLAKQPVKVLHQMLDENWKAKEQELLERTPKEFFEALPEELQYAAQYVMDGGTDMKNLFAALARVEQVKALDISTENGQLETTRAYLQATGWGRGKADAIEKQVQEWKESGKLAEKAAEFKPDLDEMQKEQVQYQLQQQAEWNKQQQKAAQAYIGNVYKAVEKADLNGLKLDKKTQATIYNGLTQLSFPSASGRPTNLLGHLLDKIQYVEPNFALLAEVTYLLSDPEGYRNAIKLIGKNEQVVDTVKKLKTEQQTNTGTSAGAGGIGDDDGNDGGSKTAKKKLSKPANILSGWTK